MRNVLRQHWPVGVTSYELRVANFELPVTSYQLPVTTSLEARSSKLEARWNILRRLLASLLLSLSLLPFPALADDAPAAAPVSPYVQEVLARARAGIAYAETMPMNPDFALYRDSWSVAAASAMLSLLDADLRVKERAEDLTRRTACLRSDLALLEDAMEEARQAMHRQLDRGSFEAIILLQHVLSYLNERERHLLKGALDPTYVDPMWGVKENFDPPQDAWCCAPDAEMETCTFIDSLECAQAGGVPFLTLLQCSASVCKAPEGGAPEEPSCPFTSDYAPPSPQGFGCDTHVLESIAGWSPAAAELETLRAVEEAIEEYRRDAESALQLERQLDEIYGQETSSAAPPPSSASSASSREHLQATGCKLKEEKYCREQQNIPCETDDDCRAEDDPWATDTCETLTSVCKNNRLKACREDADCGGGEGGECLQNAAMPLITELRGPFSLDKDHLRLLKEFFGLRTEQERLRESIDALKTPEEFAAAPEEEGEDAEEEESEREEEDLDDNLSLFRSEFRDTVRDFSLSQAKQDVPSFAESADTVKEAQNALAPLRGAVSALARLASDASGLRSFVVRYAYFLRRTCIHRPCNLVLEQILKIAFADECFPYANGAFLNDDAGDPRWKKCKRDAKL